MEYSSLDSHSNQRGNWIFELFVLWNFRSPFEFFRGMGTGKVDWPEEILAEYETVNELMLT